MIQSPVFTPVNRFVSLRRTQELRRYMTHRKGGIVFVDFSMILSEEVPPSPTVAHLGSVAISGNCGVAIGRLSIYIAGFQMITNKPWGNLLMGQLGDLLPILKSLPGASQRLSILRTTGDAALSRFLLSIGERGGLI